jgi:ABC-type amino acid transport substrate-binding protein
VVVIFIVLFSLLCMALFAVIGVFWWTRKNLGLPKRGRLGRIALWAEGVRKSEAEVKTATVGDLVLFVTLYVVGVTFVITLYIWFNQGTEDRYKQEGEQLRQTVGNREAQIHEEQKELAELRAHIEAPQLIVPAGDEEIIGNHVDLRWEYGNHNRTTDYVLQFIRIAGPSPVRTETQYMSRDNEDMYKEMDLGTTCTVAATDSADKRSRFPTKGVLAEGTYIWRVALGGLSSGSSNALQCGDDDRVREWSEYRKFTVFPSRLQRSRVTKEILVGTRFVQNLPFTRLDASGKPSGFDMDLIRIIVERCLTDDPQKGIRYDYNECDRGVSDFLDNNTKVAHYTPADHFHVKIVPVPPGVDWLEKLQSRNIDLYIGSVTRAKEREHGGVAFTSGYLTYSSEALVNKSEACDTLPCLARKKSKIGVVDSTTNAWLADELIKDDKAAGLQIVTYNSFPELESAFERQEIVGVITDGVMASTMGLNEPKELRDLKKNGGWSTYLQDHIGYPREQFAVAVASDADQSAPSSDSLLEALNCALSDKPVQTLLHTLYHSNALNELETSVADPGKNLCVSLRVKDRKQSVQ